MNFGSVNVGQEELLVISIFCCNGTVTDTLQSIFRMCSHLYAFLCAFTDRVAIVVPFIVNGSKGMGEGRVLGLCMKHITGVE